MFEVQDPTDHSRLDRRFDRPPVWLVTAAALILFVGGVGIGWLVGVLPADTATVTDTQVVTSVPTVSTPTTTIPTGPLVTSPPSVTPLVPRGSEEPVADVAEALLPSMVQIEVGSGVGSGFIYDSNGLILTAAHVVNGFSTPTVRMADGSRLSGSVVGADTVNDIAVIRVDRTGLPSAPLALDSEPRVGQMAIAIGSPWGLDSTVTAGVVSAVDRSLNGQSMIQTDASINPGNSGGALADRYGRVIGVNVSIFTRSGANDGVGFAVPIERAYRVAGALVEGRTLESGYLGVSGEDSTEGAAGAVIREILPGTPAAEAGLHVGDLVVGVDGEPVRSWGDLVARIRDRAPGEEISLDILRDGVPLDRTIELAPRPPGN